MKRLVKKIPKLVAIVLALALMAPIALKPLDADAARGRWINSYGDWYYQLPNGNLATGWQYIDGNWYFFATSSSSSASKYEMVTGMWRIDYQWYYFNASGAMVTGWVMWDYEWHYFLPGSGVVAQGWQCINGTWYYFEQGSAYDMEVDGVMLTGWWKINGESYYFESSGAMFTGWKMLSGEWYYFQPGSGSAAKGWKAIGGTWYYFDSTGIMTTGWEYIGGHWYYFDLSSGAMTTGWRYMSYEDGSGAWHYFDASGAEVYGWRKIGGNWYYFEGNESGEMVTGLREIDGDTYYFDSNGAMKTGWVYHNGSYYYFLSSGAMAKAQWIGNYYLNMDGTMATNQWVGQYYVGANGLWIPGYQGPGPSYSDGWNNIGGQWYYYVSGQKLTGLQTIGGNKYYFNANGVRQSGWVQISGLYYYFSDTDGHMLTDQWIGDYYVGTDGAWIPGYQGTNSSLQTLKQYICDYGFTNEDGNKVINLTDTSSNGTEYIGGIIYDAETDSFEFGMVSDGSSAISVMFMPVNGTNINGQNLYPEFYVYFYSNETYFDAVATINASTYTLNSTVDFTITETNNFTNSEIQDLANTFLQVGFSFWEALLNDAGLTLYDIGFTAC